MESFVPVILANKGEDLWPMTMAVNCCIVPELIGNPRSAAKLLDAASAWTLGPVGLTYEYLKAGKTGRAISRLSYRHKLFLTGQRSPRRRILATGCMILSLLPAGWTLGAINLYRSASGRRSQDRPGGDLYDRI